MAEWVQEDGTWWYVLPSGIRRRGEERVCLTCDKTFPYHKMGKNLGLYCSRACANKATKSARGRRGSDSPNWKGGYVDKDGRRYIHADRADGSRKLVGEARLVIEKEFGHELEPYQTIHHIDHTRGPDGAMSNVRVNLQVRYSPHGKGAAMRCRQCGCEDIEYVPLEGE